MIRYIIALKRQWSLVELIRVHVLVNGVSQFRRSISRAREYTFIPRITPLAKITFVRSRRSDRLPCNYSMSRAAATGGKRRAIVKILSTYAILSASFHLAIAPPRRNGENYSRRLGNVDGRFYGRSNVHAQTVHFGTLNAFLISC